MAALNSNNNMDMGSMKTTAGHKGGLNASSKSKRQKKQMAPQVQLSVQQDDFGQNFYTYTYVHPDDSDTDDEMERDELEEHFLIKAMAKTGKQKLIAVNLIRLWRILACIVINVVMFIALNFGAIDNIDVTLNNSTSTNGRRR